MLFQQPASQNTPSRKCIAMPLRCWNRWWWNSQQVFRLFNSWFAPPKWLYATTYNLQQKATIFNITRPGHIFRGQDGTRGWRWGQYKPRNIIWYHSHAEQMHLTSVGALNYRGMSNVIVPNFQWMIKWNQTRSRNSLNNSQFLFKLKWIVANGW